MRARTERPLRRFLAGLAVLTCIGSLAGCDPGAAPAPPAPAGCATMTATIDGQTSLGTRVKTTATIEEQTGGAIAVTTPEGGSGYEIDGKTATGKLNGTGKTRPFTATVSDGTYIITYRGAIIGPPTPCKGQAGRWTMVLRETGQSVASGIWTIP